jgi:hypothetical protein
MMQIERHSVLAQLLSKQVRAGGTFNTDQQFQGTKSQSHHAGQVSDKDTRPAAKARASCADRALLRIGRPAGEEVRQGSWAGITHRTPFTHSASLG